MTAVFIKKFKGKKIRQIISDKGYNIKKKEKW